MRGVLLVAHDPSQCRVGPVLVPVGDTRLNVVERGAGEPALIALHGGPGLDHTEFGRWLDPLARRLRLLLVDGRAQGRSEPAPPETWTLARFAADVEELAEALGLDRPVVLGHSFGAFVALQHAVEFPGRTAGTIVSAGVASQRHLQGIGARLAAFEPAELREGVSAAWAAEEEARTPQDVAELLAAQLPFHFADPRDPRIGDLLDAMRDARFSPDVLRAAARGEIAGPELEERLAVARSPMLVLAGRHDRICPPEAAEAIAAGAPDAELVVLERSGHMGFVEEPDAYLAAVEAFLDRL
jgi:proline iminopeptidase